MSANTNERTAVGVFPDRACAEQAIDELTRSGFAPEEVSLVVPVSRSTDEPAPEGETKAQDAAAAGAAAGGALGGLIGIALAAGAIPGIGPIVAAGGLAGFLGAATGAAGGSLVGALVGMNIPKEDAHHYERELHAGRTLVVVRSEGRYEDAVLILMRTPQEHRAEHPTLTHA